ncbi:hypothetical protein BXZ70DRAFT_1012165 [Cristinia sonorae]|uniref:Uncharacterized protein n=1 Tax=Cristinia sonorae TaxID=1940300 RepID=A0A8K0UF07_9AGAR|nr:hypothetical protein BXZ70DRAFT_1012165 [Cristinia sonorae]
MNRHLPVSSFPDLVSHGHPSPDLDLQITITPPPFRGRKLYLDRVFKKTTFRPAPPTTVFHVNADPSPDPVERRAGSGHCTAAPPPPVKDSASSSRSDDGSNHHNPHHRSTSKALPRRETSGIDGFSSPRGPRSTKESIATLGLARAPRSSSPDSITMSDTDSTVAYCYAGGWIEPQALPPLPPVPPPVSPLFQTIHLDTPVRVSSLPVRPDMKENFEIVQDEYDDNDFDSNDQDVEFRSTSSSIPPSPITFSHRNSAFITVESSSGIKELSLGPSPLTITTVSLGNDSRLRRRTPSSAPYSKEAASPLSASSTTTLAPDVPAWTRVGHFSTAALFAPAPKLLKPGETYVPPSSPSSKSRAKLNTWKIFRKPSRNASIKDVDDDQLEAGAETPPTRRAPAAAASSEYCQWTGLRKKRHRNSIHVVSITTVPTEPTSPRRASTESDRTQSTLRESDMGPMGLSGRRSVNTLRSVTTHRGDGETWREEDINSVLDTLRTMKVGRLR